MNSRFTINNLSPEILLNSQESEGDCGYFPGRISDLSFFHSKDYKPTKSEMDQLFSSGYRRIGNVYYRHQCSNCNLCLSYRILLKKFYLTRSQKKVLRKNKDLEIKFQKPKPNKNKEKLYIKYQYNQHFLKLVSGEDKQQKKFVVQEKINTMKYQMYTNIDNSFEIEIYLKNELVGFGIIDTGKISVSGVYLVYDIDYYKKSLGTYIILQTILWAKVNKYEYYNLGFYIPGHPKMNYKFNFKPGEILNSETMKWEESDDFMKNFK